MSILYQGDVGAHLLIETKNTSLPVSAVLTLIMEKPNGTVVVLPVTSGMVDYLTGVITYDTAEGDLDEIGEYRMQVHGVFVDADEVSDIDTFTVYEKLT